MHYNSCNSIQSNYRAVANDLANQLYDLFNIKHDETALFVFLFDLNNKLNDPSLFLMTSCIVGVEVSSELPVSLMQKLVNSAG